MSVKDGSLVKLLNIIFFPSGEIYNTLVLVKLLEFSILFIVISLLTVDKVTDVTCTIPVIAPVLILVTLK